MSKRKTLARAKSVKRVRPPQHRARLRKHRALIIISLALVSGCALTLLAAGVRPTSPLRNFWSRQDQASSLGAPATSAQQSGFAPANPAKEYVYLGGRLVATDEAGAPAQTPNPIDDTQFFVAQHYRDFLNREADPGGLAYWTNEIASCGNDLQCIEVKRINVSAAFFLSIEFQQTGYLVYRFYNAALNRRNDLPFFAEFIPDTRFIGNNVAVGIGDWQAQLEANKVAYSNMFVSRPEFVNLYPTSLTPEQYVNAIYAHARLSPDPTERQNCINEFGGAATTSDIGARGRAMRRIAENQELYSREYNRAFVLMQYFGYLRRDPDDVGYNFWLAKLISFGGNYVNAEMVKAFLLAGEYRGRFGTSSSPVSVSSVTAGSNVVVKAGTVTSSFFNVTTGGKMTVAPANPLSYGDSPNGYTFFKNLALNVTATAAVNPPITVSFSLAWEVNDPAEFASLRVLHREGNYWVDRTILPPDAPAPDYVSRTISARVNELSTFAIAKVNTPSKAPVVSLLKPRNGGSFIAPASVSMEAAASDPDGNISKVEFFVGGTKLSEVYSAPFVYNWNNAPAGSYSVSAKATDNTGLYTTSPYVDITVNNPSPPVGTLLADPATIQVCDGTGLGVTNLSWTSARASGVEIRVDAPNGNLFASGTAGTQATGKWVHEGTVFYLQNTSGGLPLTSANTLAKLTMHVSNEGCAASGRLNVALAANGGVATSSSNYPDGNYPPANAINGDRRGINWGTANTGGGGWHEQVGFSPHWLQVDFTNGGGTSTVRTIDEVDVFSVQDQYMTPIEPNAATVFNNYGLVDFDVQYWTGLDWATVPNGQVRNNNKIWSKVTFSPVTTNKIRIWITRTADGTSRAVEVEAWGGLLQSGLDTVWVEDGLPTGAVPVGERESWYWTNANPAQYSGAAAHQSGIIDGLHQHYFYGATTALDVNVGDALFAYVYLDPANIPAELMLQWDDGSWEHRAYWGANQIDLGVDGTASRRYMGALPAAGQWVRLEIPAAQVGLEGRAVTGLAFGLINGRATWDRAGRKKPAGANVPANQLPVATAGGPYSAMVNNGITFNGAGSVDMDGRLTNYQWDFGDGTGAAGPTTSHAYASAGSYTARLTVTDDAGGTATATAAVSITAPPYNAANFVSQSVPTVMIAGQRYNVSVTMNNSGSNTWSTANYYNLGSQNPQDNGTWGMARVALPATVAPGSSATFNFTVTAPSTPGTYNFQWRMVQDYVEWFGAYSTNVSVTVNAQPPASEQIPIARWMFEEGSGPTALDASGNGHNGKLQGDQTWVAGKVGAGALGFDGVNDYVSVANSLNVANNFTVAFWANPQATHEVDAEGSMLGGLSGQRYAYDPQYMPGDDAGAGISVGTNGVSIYEHAYNYMPAMLVYNAQSAPLNGWTHVALVYENKQPKLYINGTLVRTGQTSPRANVRLGTNQLGGMSYGYYQGQLDDVRVYDKSLNADEVRGLLVDAPVPVAFWNYDEGVGITIKDVTGNLNTGSSQGITTGEGKIGLGSCSFDGSNSRMTIASKPILTSIANNFTVSFWAYPRATHEIDAEGYTWGGVSGQRYAFEPRYMNDPDAGAGISVGTNGVSIYEHASNYMPAMLVYPTQLTGWTHITLVYENKQPKLYLNGTLVRVGQASQRANVRLSPQDIGGMSYGYYDGLLDEIAVYNRALNDEEVHYAASMGAVQNLSQGRTTAQSSDPGWGGPASDGVDGNTDGSWNNGSVTHTALDDQAWWQVDLGSVRSIELVKIWNRTDCCVDRLSNFNVYVSDVPFTSTDSTATQNQAGVSTYFKAGQADVVNTFRINRTGRYVRVQLRGANYLSLAEVQVWGKPKTDLVSRLFFDAPSEPSFLNAFLWQPFRPAPRDASRAETREERACWLCGM